MWKRRVLCSLFSKSGSFFWAPRVLISTTKEVKLDVMKESRLPQFTYLFYKWLLFPSILDLFSKPVTKTELKETLDFVSCLALRPNHP